MDPMRALLTACLLATSSFAASSYRLVWSDEFDYTGLPDPSKWGYDVGGWGWGNQELQYYQGANPKNSRVDGGVLKINVLRETTTYTDWQGNAKSNAFTSARLNTYDKQMWRYGIFKARMKLPKGAEVWPAFWLVPPAGSPYGQWPACGEIDILENWGADAIVMRASVQTKNNYGGTSLNGSTWIRDATDSFHVYALEWTPDSILASVDDLVYFRYANPHSTFADWPFDQQNFLILNVAISGNAESILATPPPDSQSLVVDYVRVYQLPDSASSVGSPARPDAGFRIAASGQTLSLASDRAGRWTVSRPNGGQVGRGWLSAHESRSLQVGGQGVFLVRFQTPDGRETLRTTFLP